MSIVLRRVCVCAAALAILSPLARAGELTREIGLIEKLGKADAAEKAKADQPPTLAEIKAAARTIDQYLQVAYKEHKVRPNPPADDTVFLRRIYLDIAGRIPTLQETLKFLKDNDPDKRAKLIDELLDSEAYVHHNFTFWADLLRVQSGNGPGTYGGQAYANWIKQSLRENKPYNKMVFELITAEGFPWENGAAGFYLRDSGMPLDHMSTTVQVFLGTSLQCAQCHDHPFDKWSQVEFYEMAAFTYGVETRRSAPNFQKAMELAAGDEAVRIALEQLARPLQYGVIEEAKQLQLPHDYQYDDAKPHDPIKPYTIFGGKAEPSEGESLRQAYARWMIDKQNPRFTLTIANRMWKKVLGIGLIEPVDTITDDTKPLIPELVSFLTYKMESYRYDLKQFQRMLYNTELYQREVTLADLPEDQPYYFPGPLLHRMSAEQFWDSIVTLAIPHPDFRRGEMSDDSYAQRMHALAGASPEQLVSLAKEQTDYDRRARELRDKVREAREAGDQQAAKAAQAQLDGLKMPSPMGMAPMMAKDGSKGSGAPELGYNAPTKDPSTWQGIPAHLVRASELQAPTDAGHFLRQFGQSDRDVVNNSNAEPNIIQVLAMFNGPAFQDVISGWSQLMKNIEKVDTPIEKVRLIFLTVLNREPGAEEKRIIQATILDEARKTGNAPDYGKVVWALLNTREFSFVR